MNHLDKSVFRTDKWLYSLACQFLLALRNKGSSRHSFPDLPLADVNFTAQRLPNNKWNTQRDYPYSFQ